MSIVDEIKNKIDNYFTDKIIVSDTAAVPTTDYANLTFGNKCLKSDFTYLFVDIRKSSELHEKYGFANAARIYKSFHKINIEIITMRNGEVRAFDGDRIMGVFSGERKNNNAVEAAMNIRWAIDEILNSKFKADEKINIGIGIDTGQSLIIKIGKGRDINKNDLVWVGKACNYASHLSCHSRNNIIISPAVYKRLNESNKFSNRTLMWKDKLIELKNKKLVQCYTTSFTWKSFE